MKIPFFQEVAELYKTTDLSQMKKNTRKYSLLQEGLCYDIIEKGNLVLPLEITNRIAIETGTRSTLKEKENNVLVSKPFT